MATSPREWRAAHPVGEVRIATTHDIAALNEVFADAFTERYRRDGMHGVRVPPLNPLIWRYAIEDAGPGALIWEDNQGRIAAFNMVHRSGTEGWMGPLCVRTEYQGAGLGKEIVRTGADFLREEGARVIGLETMPRTMDNIGFYAGLGFVPGHLTITLTLEAQQELRHQLLLSRGSFQERQHAIQRLRELTDRVQPGYDFTREIELTERLSLGDTVILGTFDAPRGFALCHSAPLVEGRARDELRVLKLVLEDRDDLPNLLSALRDQARRAGTRRVAIRLQGDYRDAFRLLIDSGARVRWTDLRMSIHGWNETPPSRGMVLSNWEI